MGYIGFTVIVAAGGAFIFWLWYRGYTASDRNARRHGTGFPGERIPPFKRTISGPSTKELAQFEFQKRLELWQSAYQARRTRLNGWAQPLEGTKYTFVPRKRNGDPISSSP